MQLKITVLCTQPNPTHGWTQPMSISGSTTRTRLDPTRHVRACNRVSDKVWSVSNSTTRTQGVVCDPTRPDSRTKCVHVETERTSLRPDKVCGLVGDLSGPWVWSGRVRVVEFSYISAACGPLLHLPHVAWSVCDTLRSFATLGVSLEEESVWTVKICKR